MNLLSQPEPFWEVRCHHVGTKGLSGLCVGYEQGNWRAETFSDYIMEWLPEFSLNSKERDSLSYANAVEKLRKAARLVYKTDKFKNRGEFGELFLHAAIRTVFGSVPAISKMYYKSSHNETVKGFDCVHVVGEIDDMELWIGEVKFYKDITCAIREVAEELEKHTELDFLRDEFVLISHKLDACDDHTAQVKTLISRRQSMDTIFKRICIPVLLTYESDTVRTYTEVCDQYILSFGKEIAQHYSSFCDKVQDTLGVRFHLFLLPIHDKEGLVILLDNKLKAWETI